MISNNTANASSAVTTQNAAKAKNATMTRTSAATQNTAKATYTAKHAAYAAADEMDAFFTEIAPDDYGCEFREGQYDMAMEVMEALAQGKHIAAEAGVGIGKSYAYLAPTLLFRKYTGAPVVVATSTIALQEQLISDMDRLTSMMGMNCKPLLAKGQSHYICLSRAKRYFNQPEALCGENRPLTDRIREEMEKGIGDRRAFGFEIPDAVWSKINITRYSKNGCRKECPYVHDCVYNRIRHELINSQFTICNQDLLTAHLNNIRNGFSPILNPETKIIVVDEAHNLEDKVRSATTISLTESHLLTMLDKATRNATIVSAARFGSRRVSDCGERAEEAVRALFRNLHIQRQKQIVTKKADMGYSERYFFRDEDNAYALFTDLVEELGELSESIELQDSFFNFEGPKKTRQAVDELERYANRLEEVRESIGSYIFWIEQRNGELALCLCPKSTDKIARQLYFGGGHSTILTSATLTGNAEGSPSEKYSYLTKSLGMPVGDKTMLMEPKESPYDYDHNAMIYYTPDLPHPTYRRREFIRKGTQRLIEILEISKGRALVLFTSKQDMEDVAAELKRQGVPYPVLVQQKGASQQDTLQKFREDVNSVLLGSGAYWEGISVEGESLSNVVVFRLPFPVPDPIIEYKESVSENPLMEVCVPEMVIKLKQGVGRLIRNATDKGIISILDSRMADDAKNGYRDIVWNALPIKHKTDSLEKIKAFYDRVVLGIADGLEDEHGNDLEDGLGNCLGDDLADDLVDGTSEERAATSVAEENRDEE